MARLVYDEQHLTDDQMYKYDEFLHSRVNKYTGGTRTLVTYFAIDDLSTTDALGFNAAYQILGPDSPLRFRKIENFVISGLSPLSPDNGNVSNTNVRSYNLNGTGTVFPNTIMPKENEFFIINHLQMNHLIRVTEVTQDGLNKDGSYQIAYQLYTTEPNEIEQLNRQVVSVHVMDLQTIGGEDLTPVIGKNDYDLRSRLIRMVDDMVENYTANFYDATHNCFLLHLNGRTLFDVCGNMFMSRNGVMIRDNAYENIVLNENKIRSNMLPHWYERSVYKWIERDAPIRYLDTFKYRIVNSSEFPDSTFVGYGEDIDVMIPGDAWCEKPGCEYYFPMEVHDIFNACFDPRKCDICDCKCCECRAQCIRSYKLKSYDYVSLIRGFIHGEIHSIQDLSLYTGDQLFDNAPSQQVFLWTPIIIYIIKQTLKIK